MQMMLLSKQNGLVDLVHCKMLSGHRVMKPSRSPPSVQVELISESDSQYTLNEMTMQRCTEQVHTQYLCFCPPPRELGQTIR